MVSPRDDAKARHWLAKAAHQGNAWSQVTLGSLYNLGRGGGKDYRKPDIGIPRPPSRGVHRRSTISQVYTRTGTALIRTTRKLGIWYTKAAKQGLALSQAELGYMYLVGKGVAQDYAKARRWYTKAAKQGLALSQAELGYMYLVGKGVAQDYAKARRWYTKAAKQGNMLAQFNLAWMYENGKGVAKSYSKARKWFTKAADQGIAAAQFNVGLMYRHGKGVQTDLVKAHELFEKAAAQGHAKAQGSLGILYENARVLKKDHEAGSVLVLQGSRARRQVFSGTAEITPLGHLARFVHD